MMCSSWPRLPAPAEANDPLRLDAWIRPGPAVDREKPL
jgi:hypothetical protein